MKIEIRIRLDEQDTIFGDGIFFGPGDYRTTICLELVELEKNWVNIPTNHRVNTRAHVKLCERLKLRYEERQV